MPNELPSREVETLRKRIKARRLFLGLTYQQLSDKTGMSKSTLQRYESGSIKNLPYERLFKLAEALEVPASYFIEITQDYTGKETFPLRRNDISTVIATIQDFEKNAISKITPTLFSMGYSIEKKSSGSLGDIVLLKEKEIWHIDFMYVDYNLATKGIPKHQLFLRFGRLATYDKPITKYSILVDKHVKIEDLLKVKPVHLDIKVSILRLTDEGYKEEPYR